ncbi:MAG: hypothetical protein K1X53_11185 [Candidatus Sumerlaeaceae bacterium]|nr:hypothetical protein [Candidatus Sumerlaeaceae bacterium]
MSEKSEQIVKKLKANLDRIVVIVMFGLLGVLIWLWFSEQSGTIGTGGGNTTLLQLKDPLPTNPDYKTYKALKETTDIAKFDKIQEVRTYNMFDFKDVKRKETLEREANAKFTSAQAAAEGGRTDEAIRLLTEILANLPSHQKARELHDKLTGKPAAGTTPAPGGAPAPPPPGGAPPPAPGAPR